jgi:hypothetical protein
MGKPCAANASKPISYIARERRDTASQLSKKPRRILEAVNLHFMCRRRIGVSGRRGPTSNHGNRASMRDKCKKGISTSFGHGASMRANQSKIPVRCATHNHRTKGRARCAYLAVSSTNAAPGPPIAETKGSLVRSARRGKSKKSKESTY